MDVLAKKHIECTLGKEGIMARNFKDYENLEFFSVYRDDNDKLRLRFNGYFYDALPGLSGNELYTLYRFVSYGDLV